MKRSSAILFTLLGLAGQSHIASAGTINFNGTVTATTCDVKLDGDSGIVTLPTVSDSQLSVMSWTAGRTAFQLSLQNCQGALKSAAAFFEAGPSVDSAGRLRNLSGTAKNVVLQLREGSGSYSPIVAGSPSQIANATYYTIPSTGIATLPYVVEYYAMGAATAGTVVSNVVYTLQYK
ncbi:fimbrial protein [Serratia sp. OLHL2]|uniref:fimbrial protein n=1 Tax=Serratia TaxID=613 RepID=UPI000C180661|nr:fimbrial protein [Serratia ureilytica]PII52054.1 fimbrial protein [Serratia sp. OLBL1]PII54423.1 fimbrial protein [Serratia sp. OLEL1]PII54870.1 fimbrial protein [Serratia sp. OLCL1]PII63648.1 fimbrial protein [Serratia sp. OLHL2]PII72115.1 fimbrial protein [Serratia sp. OLDL1]PII74302.1 fimbrial protein [Serratia sp. OLJL1]PII77776.1 fimbrial protein [Serratia sp. OLIL2]PII84368.1 fimbrial protein [Serratia sp. OLFL2]PIJ23469.1 fimbrial protein [Serratia sp. OSPLW9]PIJ33359.1 fimbrial